MEVTIAELRIVANRLFDNLDKAGRQAITIPHDYYWSVPQDERYDPYKQPSELTLGQLSDDIRELRRIATGEAQPLAYAFVWFSSIARALGEEVVI